MHPWIYLTVNCVLLTHLTSVMSIQCYVCAEKNEADFDCASNDAAVLSRHKMDCALSSGSPEVEYNILNRCATTLKNGLVTRACYYEDPRLDDNACRSGNGVTACLCSTNICNGVAISADM